MAQRTPSGTTPPTGRGSAGRQAAGRAAVSRGGKRGAPVKKPFPWGFVAGCAVLVLALGGIIFYAVQNQGVGDTTSLKYAESQISGLKSNHALARNHTPAVVTYPGQKDTPPDGGNHNPLPQSCSVYTSQVPSENVVHSLEHGAVWVTYNPDKASAADIAALTKKVTGNPYRLLSPYPGLKSKISLQAWGEQLFVSSVSDSRIDRFLDLFTGGPQAPERGGSCAGSTTTGTAPSTGGATAPMPAATK